MSKRTIKIKEWNLFLQEENGQITELHFIDDGTEFQEEEGNMSPVLENVVQQLTEYFDGKRKEFDLPLAPKGTAFQKKVWKALQEIPYGKTVSYQDIAIAVGNPKGCRAVGMANNRNPIPIIIPCHRVIGKNGKMVGYGAGLDKKTKLLQLEGILD